MYFRKTSAFRLARVHAWKNTADFTDSKQTLTSQSQKFRLNLFLMILECFWSNGSWILAYCACSSVRCRRNFCDCYYEVDAFIWACVRLIKSLRDRCSFSSDLEKSLFLLQVFADERQNMIRLCWRSQFIMSSTPVLISTVLLLQTLQHTTHLLIRN